MKGYDYLARLFAGLAVLLSNVMCAAVAYGYCALQWGGRYAGYSASPGVAFWLCVPYGIGIIICAAMARFFHKKRPKPV